MTIEKTILSVSKQTTTPIEWIIINDGSEDQTVGIIEKYSKLHTWIKVIHVADPKITEISARIAFLFNYGVSQLTTDNYSFIMKLDADVILCSSFCDDIINYFLHDKYLGIASGLVEYRGKREINTDVSMTRGAAKFYRKKCWEEIGGVYLSRGWDTMDNYAAQYYGWKTRSFDIYFEHCKEEGKRSGLFKKHYWTGLYNGRIPYHPLYFILKLAKHSFKKPIIIGSIIQLYAYLMAAHLKKERPFPKEISNYVRKMQLEKIIYISRKL
jgi:glycosyltransferase involved in cell wall biosynthesis